MLGNQKLINVRKENRLSMYFGTVVYNFSCLIRLSYLFYFILFYFIALVIFSKEPGLSPQMIGYFQDLYLKEGKYLFSNSNYRYMIELFIIWWYV